jgi:deoxycytidylate deaminase
MPKDIWLLVKEVAAKSNCRKRHVGCVILDENNGVVSTGYNYHPNGVCDCVPGPSTALHAEMVAINNIPVYDIGRKLYAFVSHHPCENCQKNLDAVTVKTIVNPISERIDILEERASTHGDFEYSAEFTQKVKRLFEDTPNWEKLHDCRKEALHMIAHKVARILYGDPDHEDSWVDIGGYAELCKKIEEEL